MPTAHAKRFEIDLHRLRADSGSLTAGPRPAILGGAPPEYGGSEAVWSPEHLLLAAVALCFQTTLEFHARRAALPLLAFTCHGEGTVDKTAVGLAFTEVHLVVQLSVPAGQAARARELLESAKKTCLISNSLRPAVELSAQVVEIGDDATLVASMQH